MDITTTLSPEAIATASALAAGSPWQCDHVSGNGLCGICERTGRCEEIDRLATALDAFRAQPRPVFGAGKGLFYCSFCGKNQHEVALMIAGPTVFVCDDCLGLAGEIVAAHPSRATSGEPSPPSAMQAALADAVAEASRHTIPDMLAQPELIRHLLRQLSGDLLVLIEERGPVKVWEVAPAYRTVLALIAGVTLAAMVSWDREQAATNPTTEA